MSPDASNLAFSWRGDIWTVPVSGGTALRLTAPAATTFTHPDPMSALKAALAAANPEDRILVFGSFFTVGGVLHEGLPKLNAPHLQAKAD